MNSQPEITIARALRKDATEILRLQKIAYISEAKLLDDFSIPPLQQTIAEILAEFGRQVFLKAVHGDLLVGSVRCFLQADTSYIGKLIVQPEYQNAGIGTRLLAAAERRFPAARRYELFTSQKSEKNLHFYLKNGYRKYREQRVSEKLTLIFLEKPIFLQ